MEQFEPPKYIASLIAAINDGAKSAQIGALAFTAIGLFLLATAFSATDEDLLLNHAISISQLGGAQVPVVFAFGLAPTVFLAAHLYTLIRYDMLASNLRQLLADLPRMVPLEADRERCRQLLANVEFVNDLVMPPKSRASSWMFRWTVVFLLAVFPVAVLLLVQISSLRLQHAVVNTIHHSCLVIDLVLLVWFFGRRGGDGDWSFWTAPQRRHATLCALPVVVMAIDLAWLNVPGADATTVREDILDYADYGQQRHDKNESLLDRRTRVLLALPVQPIDLLICPYVGWGCRFLTVTHRPLVAKVWDARGFTELRGGAEVTPKSLAAIERASLRGRVLRFAVLTGSELFGADLTGAQLQHADLTDVVMKGAVLPEAQLQQADLTIVVMKGAVLEEAQLQGTDLTSAQLQGADLFGARLQDANLSLAELQGANLAGAKLQGANLVGAQLQGADLRGAQLQGANLSSAKLQGAVLLKAQLQGADLRDAHIWNVEADAETRLGLADLRGVSLAMDLTESAKAELLATIPISQRAFVEMRLTPRVGARTLPRVVGTQDGPVLVYAPRPTGLRSLGEAQVTDDQAGYETKLGRYLAEEVAPIAPEVAERLAHVEAVGITARFASPQAFGCPLLALASAGKVTLSQDTTERLKERVGACP